MKLSRKFAAIAGAACLAVGAGTANAAVSLELGLALDESGSISAAEFNLQRNAYINVLSDLSVLPRNGTIAIGVKKFGSATTNVFTTAVITNANHGALITALTNMLKIGGGTNIGSAINAFTTEITTNGIISTRQLIDVSTDGFGTVGTSRQDAIAAGIDQINCIGIGPGADCTVVQFGPGSFSLQANTFAEFETALRRKIVREVQGGVPEPDTWMMMILGFGVIGIAVRRRNASNQPSFV